MMASENLRVFSQAFKETVTSHFAGIGGVIAGGIVAWQLDIFKLFPWAIAVYPIVLIAKSVMTVLFSGRLNTSLYVGTVYPRFLGNTRVFYGQIQALTVITLLTSVITSVFSMILGALILTTWKTDLLRVVMTVGATMNLGLTLGLFTLALTFRAFKSGLDLDSVTYPILGVVADVFITLCYALILNILVNLGDLGIFVTFLMMIAPLIVVALSLGENLQREFVRAVKRSVPAILSVAILANLAGTVFQTISTMVNAEKETIIAYPGLIELTSDIILVVGYNLTARLALGLDLGSFTVLRNNLLHGIGVFSASMVAVATFSVLPLLLAGSFTITNFLTFGSLMLTAVVIIFAVSIIVAYFLSVLAFRKSLDPDHFVIPFAISLSGAVGSACLLASLLLRHLFLG